MDNATAMMKLLGLDPEKIKSMMTESKDEIMKVVNGINVKLDNIQESLTRIEVKLDTFPYDTPVEILPERMLTHGGNNGHDSRNGITI